MPWHNAPVLNKLTASQQGGSRGAQLWGVDFRGSLHTVLQKTPGGEWGEWEKLDLTGPNRPRQVYELAATQMSDGRVVLFVLDVKQELWTLTQTSAGGDWGGWERPDWNGMAQGDLKKLCAAPHGGKRLGQMWALMSDGILVGNNQVTADGRWFQGWYEWEPSTVTEKHRFIEVTAAPQGNGHSILWGLDANRRLWSARQTSSDEHPPSGWEAWQGPNWQGAPKLRNIAACESTTGAHLWGIDEEYRMVSIFQTAPGSDKWSGWSSGDWMNAPFSYELTAAAQNNGCAQVWAIDLHQVLHSIAQTPRGWDLSWVPGRRRS
jgi:hypothetical protein